MIIPSSALTAAFGISWRDLMEPFDNNLLWISALKYQIYGLAPQHHFENGWPWFELYCRKKAVQLVFPVWLKFTLKSNMSVRFLTAATGSRAMPSSRTLGWEGQPPRCSELNSMTSASAENWIINMNTWTRDGCCNSQQKRRLSQRLMARTACVLWYMQKTSYWLFDNQVCPWE